MLSVGLRPMVSFYRIFYRTGRNGLVIHSTLQHDESRKARSDGTRRTQQHQPTPLQREFKSPLAHSTTDFRPQLGS
jgi:hypothetical protein